VTAPRGGRFLGAGLWTSCARLGPPRNLPDRCDVVAHLAGSSEHHVAVPGPGRRAGVGSHLGDIRIEVSPDGPAADDPSPPPSSDGTSRPNFVAPSSAGLRVSSTGLARGSPAHVWLFSMPVLLAELTTDHLGGVTTGSLPLPEQVTSCAHTLQLVGRDVAGREVAVPLGQAVTMIARWPLPAVSW